MTSISIASAICHGPGGSVDDVLEHFGVTFHRRTRDGEKDERVPWNIGVGRFDDPDG